MPSKNKSQHQFMAMSASAEGRARLKSLGKKPAPMAVAKEFLAADKGRFRKRQKRKR